MKTPPHRGRQAGDSTEGIKKGLQTLVLTCLACQAKLRHSRFLILRPFLCLPQGGPGGELKLLGDDGNAKQF
jgi:hypothetical protein